jgi:hypothetical protein
MKFSDDISLEIQKLFSGPINQYIWLIEGSEYGVLTFNFGKPHLRILGPMETEPGLSPQLLDVFGNRIVKPTGEWHIFIFTGNWSVKTKYYVANRGSTGSPENDKALKRLDGQKLLRVSYTPDHVSHFEFDLGGVLQIWPSDDVAAEEEPQETVWTLFYEDRSSVSLNKDQTLSFDPAPNKPLSHKAG